MSPTFTVEQITAIGELVGFMYGFVAGVAICTVGRWAWKVWTT